MRNRPTRPTLIRALIALAALAAPAAPAGAQAARDTPPPPPAADLFRPIPASFDFTPDQQRAIESLRADPSSGAIQLFRVNLAVPKTADAVNFNLAPGMDLRLSTRSRQDRNATDYSWMGGDATGDKSAALVVKDQQVTGTIRDGDKLYRVRPLGSGVHAVVEVDQKKLPPEHPPAFDRRESAPKEPPPLLLSRRAARTAVAPQAAAPLATTMSTTEPTPAPSAATRAATRVAIDPRTAAAASRAEIPARADAPGSGGSATPTPPAGGGPAADACGPIDVLVAYTPAAAAQSGGIEALVQLAVDETNNSYLNSGIQTTLRLVHLAPTEYVESGDMEVDVARLVDRGDGFLDDVPPLRDAHGADLAVLVTGNGNFCGIAADILATADNAYAVVGQNCATGYYSFGHEVGHLQGARHNPEADDTATPFAYGHGFFSLANRKRTVMSYDCPLGCTRIDVWADPTVVVQGVAMGEPALHHDARVLNETACDMAGFRAAATGSGPTPGTPAPTTPVAPRPAPAASLWSLLALLAAAPLALRRPARG